MSLRSSTEQRLAALWSEVLECPVVSANAQFLALGGDSFAATRLIARVTQEFGVRLRVQMFLDGVVLEQQAAEIDIAACKQVIP